MNDLRKLLNFEATEIDTGFKKASFEGKGTSQEVSDRREPLIKNFISKYFPFPYRIAKGNIVDSFGNRSKSIDCIILNPQHPNTLSNTNGLYSVIFADGVDAAIEIKPKLDKDEILRALTQIKSVKELTRVKTSLFNTDDIKNYKDDIYKIYTFIFTNESFSNNETLIEHIKQYYSKNKVERNNQFDFIIINNKGILFNNREGGFFDRGTLPIGLIFFKTNEDTLLHFLFWLNKIPVSSPKLSSDVISYYIKFENTDMEVYEAI
ncbi:hypothetical protein BZ13_1208 [Francisella philomiragia subsp. philomiragia ATCC 25015]|uniref:DUF6602 domain-containing protein n=1 Tax=Francisella philomiragia TaxID=28110 RepID=UPI0001AF7A70|nr:DUF6602 domain-containing protein [Francisella philomiragia]AJI74238.1 hypothetical protein BZ13_1208 [Francisella philomiragia subsp. philomiragia ATCC 25015]EET20595.1 predicted protein [Francisella philomiragia subsp. philomiragia ATCC 25015]MBK2237636.1 hypothetical protein [Francisella philomiragia]